MCYILLYIYKMLFLEQLLIFYVCYLMVQLATDCTTCVLERNSSEVSDCRCVRDLWVADSRVAKEGVGQSSCKMGQLTCSLGLELMEICVPCIIGPTCFIIVYEVVPLRTISSHNVTPRNITSNKTSLVRKRHQEQNITKKRHQSSASIKL